MLGNVRSTIHIDQILAFPSGAGLPLYTKVEGANPKSSGKKMPCARVSDKTPRSGRGSEQFPRLLRGPMVISETCGGLT